jgi:hypothetical protein
MITKVFVNLYDTSLDYIPVLLPMYAKVSSSPHVIAIIGLVKFSTNMVSTSTQMGFKVDLQDLTLSLSNRACPYDDDEAACGWIQRSIASGNHNWTSSEDFLSDNGFVSILRCDFLDCFIRLYLNEMSLEAERSEVEISGNEVRLECVNPCLA